MIYDKLSYEILHFLFEEKSSSFSNFQTSVISNPRTLSKKLKILSDNKLLMKSAGIYKITDKGLTFFEMFQDAIFVLHGFNPSIEALRIPILLKLALQEYIKTLKSEFRENLVSVILFGSFSTDSWDKTSDIDLAIFLKEINQISQLFEQFTLCRRKFRTTNNYKLLIQKDYSFRIQHVPFDIRNSTKFHNLFPDLITTGIVLYDHEGFYREFKDKIFKIIEQKELVKVINISGCQYWKSLRKVS